MMGNISDFFPGGYRRRPPQPERKRTLLEAMAEAGIEPGPGFSQPVNGEFVRFSTNGKKSDRTGWIIAHADQRGFTFGCWRQDVQGTWFEETDARLTPNELAAIQRRCQEMREKAQAEREERQDAAAERASEQWAEAQPAHPSNPYLLAKKLPPLNLKASGGHLIVPVYGEDGQLQSLQTIDPKGSKLFLKGGKAGGGYCALGHMEQARTLYIGEGWATVASAHLATNTPALVAFNAGNLEVVCLMARKRWPTAKLVILADDDAGTDGNPGITKAKAAAQACGGTVAYPPREGYGPDESIDFSDVWVRYGREVVAAALEAEPAQTPTGYGWHEAVWGECPAPAWIMRDVLVEQQKMIVTGESGSCKSFLTVDMACCIASGRPWHGFQVVKPVGVLVVLLEGQGMYRKRLRAWALHHGLTKDDPALPVWVCPESLSLVDRPDVLRGWVEDAERQMQTKVGVILVDTLSLALGSGDESNNADVSRALANADAAAAGRNLIYVHHPGHGDKTRERGAYQIRANADVRLMVERSDENKGDLLTVTCAKQKDSEEFPPFHLLIQSVDTGWRDDIGRAMTSLVLVDTDREPVKTSNKPLGRNQQLVVDLIAEAGGRLPKAELRQKFKDAGVPASRLSEAVKQLIDAGILLDGMTSYALKGANGPVDNSTKGAE